MPLQVHPLLAEKDEQPAPEEPTASVEAPVGPEEPVAPAPIPEPAVAAEPEPAPVVPEPEDFYRIGKSTAYQDITRLENEIPELRNRINSLVGRKASNEYKPKIAELEQKLAEAEARLHQQEMASLDEETVKTRLLNDPDFRNRYGKEPEDPQIVALRNSLNRSIDHVRNSYVDQVGDQVFNQFEQSLREGWFDTERDAVGRPGRALTPTETVAHFQAAVSNYAIQMARAQGMRAIPTRPAPAPAAQVPQPPEPKPVAVANPALAQASPDLSTPVGTTGKQAIKMSEYRSWTPQVKIQRIPNLERALADGTVVRDE